MTSEPQPDLSAAPDKRPFYGKPFMWLLFALVLFALPLIGYMVRADMGFGEVHPAVNAMLNGSSSVFLIAGYIAVRRRNIAFHKSCMIGAVVASTLFLISYVIRFAVSGSHRYPGTGADKLFYLAILFSHMILAAVVLPMAVRTVYLAWRKRFDRHRAIARWTWPIWIYVSITGVVVYLMLYPIAGAVYGR